MHCLAAFQLYYYYGIRITGALMGNRGQLYLQAKSCTGMVRENSILEPVGKAWKISLLRGSL